MINHQSSNHPMHDLMDRLGYQFKDESLLNLALSHRSFSVNNNERLEFLGDAILGFVIANALYHQFPKAQEGHLSRLRANMVRGVTLAEVALELDIGEALLLGAGEKRNGGHRRQSILADTFEAIIGAIYLDSDTHQCESLILAWFASRLSDLNLKTNQKDAKTQLQEFLQARKQALPEYTLIETTGKDHQQVFSMACYVAMLGESTYAKASSRRVGEQKTAAIALEKLQNLSRTQ